MDLQGGMSGSFDYFDWIEWEMDRLAQPVLPFLGGRPIESIQSIHLSDALDTAMDLFDLAIPNQNVHTEEKWPTTTR